MLSGSTLLKERLIEYLIINRQDLRTHVGQTIAPIIRLSRERHNGNIVNKASNNNLKMIFKAKSRSLIQAKEIRIKILHFGKNVLIDQQLLDR